MLSEQQELERILKEIYNNFYERRDRLTMHIDVKTNTVLCGFAYEDSSLYYKLNNGRLIREHMNLIETSFTNIISRMVKLATQRDVEYVAYVDYHSCMTPSFFCIELNSYGEARSQFFESLQPSVPVLFSSDDIFSAIKTTDPLTQILLYRALMLRTGAIKNAYICWDVIAVMPFGSDPTSIFHGKKGMVAYCSTLSDLIFGRINLKEFSDQMSWLVDKSRYKLTNNKELDELHKKDPAKACDINLIESIIHDEIEKANELMRQYGIIRVAFPLE